MNLRVAIVQTRLHWQDPVANLESLSERLATITGNTDVIVLPEMFSTGFSMNTASAEKMEGSAMKWMLQKAVEFKSVVCGSLMMEEHGRYFNRFIWMSPEGHYDYYDKRHLFSMANEHRHFVPGKEKLIVKLGDWNICPLICYDLRFPVWSRNRANQGVFDYDLLIYVANWPERRAHAWKSLLVARAIENQAYVVGVNRVGRDGNDISYSGDSAVLDFLGERISRTERYGDRCEVVEISLEALRKYRISFPASQDADLFNLMP